MTDVAERYRKLAGAMADRISAVPDGRWEAPAPCEGWTALDVVKHLSETPGIFFGMVGETPPSGGPSVDDDPLGAFNHAREAVQAALDDPNIADKEYDGALGKNTFAGGVDRFICADLVVHAWDLGRATGGDERLDPDEVRAIHEAMLPMDEMMRAPGAFGPKIEPAPDADEQTKLLNFLGREV